MRLFMWVVGVLVAGVGLTVAYGLYLTNQERQMLELIGELPVEDRVDRILAVRDLTHDRLLEVAQLVLITPALTLLSTIIGFVLGRNTGDGA